MCFSIAFEYQRFFIKRERRIITILNSILNNTTMQLESLTVLFVLLSSFLVTFTTHAAPVSLVRREDDDDDDGGKTYHGQATWFVPADEGGPIGACGGHEDNDFLIVALNHEQYGDMDAKSKWCNKKIMVKGVYANHH